MTEEKRKIVEFKLQAGKKLFSIYLNQDLIISIVILETLLKEDNPNEEMIDELVKEIEDIGKSIGIQSIFR